MSDFSKNILYHDNHVILAFKPTGMLSQKDATNDPSILEHIKHYIKRRYNKPGEVFLGSVHRIDRPASGLMVFAKTSKALKRLNAQMKKGEIDKHYYAIVEGEFEGPPFEINNYIAKKGSTNVVTVSQYHRPGFKEAKSIVTPIRVMSGRSLLSIQIQTGRKHQIRAQMGFLGYPIKGDMKYGATSGMDDRSICLTSYRLKFVHPVRKEIVDHSLPIPVINSAWKRFI